MFVFFPFVFIYTSSLSLFPSLTLTFSLSLSHSLYLALILYISLPVPQRRLSMSTVAVMMMMRTVGMTENPGNENRHRHMYCSATHWRTVALHLTLLQRSFINHPQCQQFQQTSPEIVAASVKRRLCSIELMRKEWCCLYHVFSASGAPTGPTGPPWAWALLWQICPNISGLVAFHQ